MTSPAAPIPQAPPVAGVLRTMRARAEHPRAWALYDLSIDLLTTLTVLDAVLAEHAAVPAAPGQAATECASCRVPIDHCRTRQVVNAALSWAAAHRGALATRPDPR